METFYLKPSDIRFSQDSIAAYFRDGSSLVDTLWDLAEGKTRIEDRRTLSVVYRRDEYWTLNNRSLWVYQQLEKMGACQTVKVHLVYLREIDLRSWYQRFTTRTWGRTIKIRGITSTAISSVYFPPVKKFSQSFSPSTCKQLFFLTVTRFYFDDSTDSNRISVSCC